MTNYQLVAAAKQLRQRFEEIAQQRQQAIEAREDFESEYELEDLKAFVEQLVLAIFQQRLESYTKDQLVTFLERLQSFTSELDQELPPSPQQQPEIGYLNSLQASFLIFLQPGTDLVTPTARFPPIRR